MAVYAVVAACSGGAGSKMAAEILDGGTGADALVDAIEEPVGDARADVTTSGSRLKARYYAGEDGSKQFNGWHDSMLNIDCAYTRASDTQTRCLPSVAPFQLRWYADANCTSPLYAVTTAGCKPPAYAVAVSVSTAACGDESVTSHVYAPGAQFTGATIYDGAQGTQCSGQPASNLSNVTFYATGAELPPAQFARAFEQVEP